MTSVITECTLIFQCHVRLTQKPLVNSDPLFTVNIRVQHSKCENANSNGKSKVFDFRWWRRNSKQIDLEIWFVDVRLSRELILILNFTQSKIILPNLIKIWRLFWCLNITGTITIYNRIRRQGSTHDHGWLVKWVLKCPQTSQN